jgi:hypothetical protein
VPFGRVVVVVVVVVAAEVVGEGTGSMVVVAGSTGPVGEATFVTGWDVSPDPAQAAVTNVSANANAARRS